MSPYPASACVVESTYGGVARPPEQCDIEARLQRLESALESALLERRGIAVMPAFALGRTQDVLLDLHILWARNPRKFAGIPVYFDAPMAHKANVVHGQAIGRNYESGGGKRRPAWLGKELFGVFGLDPHNPDDTALLLDCLHEMLLPKSAPKVPRRGTLSAWRRIHETRVFDAAATRGPALVVSGGGMCEGGRISDWLRAHLAAPTTTVLFTGYCAQGTVGGRLLDLARMPVDERPTPDGMLASSALRYEGPIRAHIEAIGGYSAHADQNGLLEWVFERRGDGIVRAAGRTVFVQHGNTEQRRRLAELIEARAAEHGLDVHAELPTLDHGWFDLDAGAWDVSDRTEEQLLRQEVARLRARVTELEGRLAEFGS
jgi:metallo-beta-lactamase family protein